MRRAVSGARAAFRSPSPWPSPSASACSRSACSSCPWRARCGQAALRSRPSRTRPGSRARSRCGPCRGPSQAQAADARAARGADRGVRARRPVSLRRQLAEWVRLLRVSSPTSTRSSGSACPTTPRPSTRYGRSVDRSHLKPGDLVFFHGLGHVGLYIGHGRIIHAPQSGERVSIQSLASRSGSVEGARRLARS